MMEPVIIVMLLVPIVLLKDNITVLIVMLHYISIMDNVLVVVTLTSGLMMTLENVNHVTILVMNVTDLNKDIVILVILQITYSSM